MGTTLDALQTLQQVELKLAALRRKINRKQRSLDVHRKRIATHQRELERLHLTIQQHQVGIDQLELDVKSRDDEIVRLREALDRSKTNKEYAAVLSQINTGKADNSKIEERMLELMGELETLRKREAEINHKIVDEDRALENASRETEAFAAGSRSELETLESRRADAAEAVPSDTLAIFERVAERHEGEALAAVMRPHPKREEFICDGCNMSVTLEQYVALRGGQRIQVCNSCGRVLYLDAECL